ncbi:MAG: HDOD domain-containing protein [Gammaproteobacteria bacterium]|nr:MAG: HDOD domain-containing protein [Gammaproteobacteria bacterium]
MFESLKKLFSGDPAPARTAKTGGSASTPPEPALPDAFLQRDVVFDRRNRLAGHLFSLQFPYEPSHSRRQCDQALLDTLNASSDAWNTGQVFIPIAASSLDLPAIDRLRPANTALLVDLDIEGDPQALISRFDELHGRGLRLGLFRNPRHPAFAALIARSDLAALNVAASDGNTVRDFSAAIRAGEKQKPVLLFGSDIETLDDHRLCHQWHFEYFHGPFAASAPPRKEDAGSDPHKVQLLHLMRLVQGDAENAEIAEAMKQDPLLAFRILRYLNSPALGLNHPIDSLSQALIILGRQRLTRWLAVLLFSVREPDFGDWLLVESALTRGRLMEVLGESCFPGQATDPLFLTGIFSCLDRLLRRPMAEALGDMPLAPGVRDALLSRSGPYAPLLAVAEAADSFDLSAMADTAVAAGIDAARVNRALLAATAWASEVTEHWE